jgi:hypothetical protein
LKIFSQKKQNHYKQQSNSHFGDETTSHHQIISSELPRIIIMKLALFSFAGTVLLALTALDASTTYCHALLRGGDVDDKEEDKAHQAETSALTAVKGVPGRERGLQSCQAALIRCPLTTCKVTSPFGWRESTNSMHYGVDYAGNSGDPVLAAADGVIEGSTPTNQSGGHGERLILRHNNGAATLYAHLTSRIAKVNDKVTAGTKIGTVGNTGNSQGPHLHLEYVASGSMFSKPKRQINPEPCVSGTNTVSCTSSAGQSGVCKPISECTVGTQTTETNRCPSISNKDIKCCFTPKSCTVSSGKKGICI